MRSNKTEVGGKLDYSLECLATAKVWRLICISEKSKFVAQFLACRLIILFMR